MLFYIFIAMLQRICGYKDSEVKSVPFRNQNTGIIQMQKSTEF